MIEGEMMSKPTTNSNRSRIISLEEDMTKLEERVLRMENLHIDLMARLDTILRISKVIAGIVAAGLGFDLGVEEML